jgi:D-inositol-3-phosphate glycosyltransferase
MNIYIRNLTAELSKMGHMVDVFTCPHDEGECSSNHNMDENINVFHIDKLDFKLISESNLQDRLHSIAGQISSHLHKYDVIHSHYWFSGLAGDIISRQWKVPHITMFHTLGKLKNSAGLGELEPPTRIDHETSIVKHCNLIIASTESEKKELVKSYNAADSQVTVIPCGLDQELFRPVNRHFARKVLGLSDKKTVLFVGRFDPLKGLQNVLDAVSMPGYSHDFQLLVVGDNEVGSAHGASAPACTPLSPSCDNVIFTGSVPHEKMYLYYGASDLCLIPSYYESFSLTAVEAIACQTPVLATAVGEIPGLARLCHFCRIIPDNTPSSLAYHIDDMLGSPACAIASRDLMLNYRWKSIAERLVNEYAATIGQRNAKLEAVLQH